MPLRRLAAALLWVPLASVAPAGCDDAEEPAGQAGSQLPPRPGVTRQGQADAARAKVDALLAAPGPGPLLAALAQDHGVARELLGRHVLRSSAKFSLLPTTPARPVVDEPVLLAQEVADELELRWGSGPGEPVRMALSQHTDKHRGREVTIVDERAYTRMMHRGWEARPVDSDVHLRWLDEAQRSVHDAVALAAPALAVTAVEEGEAVRVELSLAAAADPSQAQTGPGREWRGSIEITAIRGQITLQRATGLWQRAELHVEYGLTDALGRKLAGETHLTGSVEAAPELEIRAPEHAQPLPERVRYEVERRRLLGGLAGT